MYKILKAEMLAENIYLMDVEAARVAKSCLPGQFVIVKIDEKGERIPLTICDYNREKGTVTIVFQIVGASTMRMATLKEGDSFRDFATCPVGQAGYRIYEGMIEKSYIFVICRAGCSYIHTDPFEEFFIIISQPG